MNVNHLVAVKNCKYSNISLICPCITSDSHIFFTRLLEPWIVFTPNRNNKIENDRPHYKRTNVPKMESSHSTRETELRVSPLCAPAAKLLLISRSELLSHRTYCTWEGVPLLWCRRHHQIRPSSRASQTLSYCNLLKEYISWPGPPSLSVTENFSSAHYCRSLSAFTVTTGS
jgi:hypothetical protein